jgi:glycosyltransferase involved in cell wall biosynthesis
MTDRQTGAPCASVVIATRNRAVLLERCLASLAEGSTDEPYEIVVVDNASTDSTAAVVDRAATRWPFVRRVSESRPGSARALHTGASNAHADVLIFVDDDMVAVPRFVAHHLRVHREHPGCCGLGDIRSAPSRHPFDRMQAYIFDGPRISLASRAPAPSDYWSGNASLARATYFSLGGYREEFGDIGYGKDVDFGQRLVAAGIPLRFVPQALTHHHFTERFADRLRKAYRAGLACAYLSVTNPAFPIEPTLLVTGRRFTPWLVWVCRLIAAALEPFDHGDTVPPTFLLTYVYDMGLRAATRAGVRDYRTGRVLFRTMTRVPPDRQPQP